MPPKWTALRRPLTHLWQPDRSRAFNVSGTHLPQGTTPLWRLHRWSPVYPGLPHPAPSALGLSQPCDGFLLHTASLSSFIQAPPLGFKEQKRCTLTRMPRNGQSEDNPLSDIPHRARRQPKAADTDVIPPTNQSHTHRSRCSPDAYANVSLTSATCKQVAQGGGHANTSMPLAPPVERAPEPRSVITPSPDGHASTIRPKANRLPPMPLPHRLLHEMH